MQSSLAVGALLAVAEDRPLEWPFRQSFDLPGVLRSRQFPQVWIPHPLFDSESR